MTTDNKPKFAFHCSACGAMLNNFEHSKKLPNGQEDDLCNSCIYAISTSSYTSYRDYQHLGVTDGITQTSGLDDFEYSRLDD